MFFLILMKRATLPRKTHARAKKKLGVQLVQNIYWKRTDGRDRSHYVAGLKQPRCVVCDQ